MKTGARNYKKNNFFQAKYRLFNTRYEVPIRIEKVFLGDVGNPLWVVRTHGSAFGMTGIVI
jgi:hypothetical protein